jgi:hypothetical protein
VKIAQPSRPTTYLVKIARYTAPRHRSRDFPVVARGTTLAYAGDGREDTDMLKSTNAMLSYTILATDGEIGQVIRDPASRSLSEPPVRFASWM